MANKTTLVWNPRKTDRALAAALKELATDYPISAKAVDGKSLAVSFVKTDDPATLSIARSGDSVTVSYGALSSALRAVGTLLSGVLPADGCAETSPFEKLGIMLDCSRNAVMRVDYLRKWFRQLCLMGYNEVMLYTEDTYEIPGEDYFGFMRGAYTAKELREIDAYASLLGMETIGCIQTLGHLAQILHWGAFRKVKDTWSVLLVGEPETYKLIEKMIAQISKNIKSRRIHVGMDETHDLGRGRYMDLHGYKRGYDLFNEHIKKVVAICRKYGLEPMIWSDMYFRMASKNMDYYDRSSQIPADIKKAVPKGIDLVYWDYYHEDEGFYTEWIKRHRELGREPLMGSGVWTWGIPWYGRGITERTVGPCVSACRKAGVKNIFYTLWGDDGAYCDYDSCLAGLLYAAELSCTGAAPEAVLEKKLRAICNASYADQVAPCAALGWAGVTPRLLWDDPFVGRWYFEITAENPKQWKDLVAEADKAVASIKLSPKSLAGGGDLAHAKRLAEFLSAKGHLVEDLHAAYAKKDRKALKKAGDAAVVCAKLCSDLIPSFKKEWFKKNKPFGWEFLNSRLSGQVGRFMDIAERVGEYLSGKAESLPELEVKVPAKIKG